MNQTPAPSAAQDAAVLTDTERLTLANAVHAHTSYPPPRGTHDLSSVQNAIERAVEGFLAARAAHAHPPGPGTTA